ncbi:hypothetical protein IM25_23355 (plasmid) [Rhodococcus sp. p52]|nr:hypothetical protein IM25_23355 [Rhodococcus sp. p52]
MSGPCREFVLLFRRRDPSTGALGAARLVRVDLHAAVTIGPPLETAMMAYRPFLTGSPRRSSTAPPSTRYSTV